MRAHLAAGGKSSCPEASFSFGFQHTQISEQRRAYGILQLSVGGDDVGPLSTVLDDALGENTLEDQRTSSDICKHAQVTGNITSTVEKKGEHLFGSCYADSLRKPHR